MEAQDLFAVGRKRKRVPKPKSIHAKRIQEIMLRVYFPLYVKACGEKPLIQPRDWGLLRLVVDEYGPDVVEARLRDFFRMDDRWVREAGYSIGIFRGQWPKLAARALQQSTIQTPVGQPPTKCLHQPTCHTTVEHSRKIVAEMRGTYRSTPPTSSASSRTVSTLNDPF